MAFSALLLCAIAAAALLVGYRLPSGFLPIEDQGYFYLNIQLPDVASLQRTDAFAKKVEALLKSTPGVQYYSTIVGNSLLTQTAKLLVETLTNSATRIVPLASDGEDCTRTSVSERGCRYVLEDRLAFARLLAPSRCFCSVGSVWLA
jgi:multidrug efflux pump subunit AcrB